MKFSLIIPVYNVEQYLEKCLMSILDSTYQNYEVIIVNDGSVDNSEKIIKDNLNKFKNVTYIKQKNKGLSSARNEGVKKATGDYICFIDSDDYIEKDMLDVLNNNLKDQPDLLRYQLREVYSDKSIAINEEAFDTMRSTDAFKKIVKYKYIEMSQLYVYKTSFYKENNFCFKEGIYHEDFLLIPIIIAKSKTIKAIDYVGYNYLIRDGSIMRNNDKDKVIKKMDDSLGAFQEAITILDKLNDTATFKNFYANSILDKYFALNDELKNKYAETIKKLDVFSYMATDNVKRKIKKIIYKIKFGVRLWKWV